MTIVDAWPQRSTPTPNASSPPSDGRSTSALLAMCAKRGESFTVTRHGIPVARLVPLHRKTFARTEEVFASFASVPHIDAAEFRADLDAAFDQDPFSRDY